MGRSTSVSLYTIVPGTSRDRIGKTYVTDEVETRALRDVTLSIDRGEYVSIEGPSGFGKSTLVSIVGFLDTPTQGTYVRAAIRNREIGLARALAGNPSVLLADEPTGNLDSKHGEAVMELLAELHEQGSTIIVVTHDRRFARYAHRTIGLLDGRLADSTELVEAHL